MVDIYKLCGGTCYAEDRSSAFLSTKVCPRRPQPQRRCCYSDKIREDEMGKNSERKGEMINAYKILVDMKGKGVFSSI
jgi:hypothetical protein